MEEKDIDELYGSIADLAVSLSMEHSALKIAAVLNAVGMSIYKTALSETDYEKMCKTIFDPNYYCRDSVTARLLVSVGHPVASLHSLCRGWARQFLPRKPNLFAKRKLQFSP